MSKIIGRLEEGILALLLAGMTILTFAQVVMRYAFNSGMIWSLEATVYLFAWLIAVLDSIQERRWGWLIAMLLLLPLWIGPLLYSVFGPRNTK